MKLFFTKILPLLLPIAIYVGWLIYARKRAKALGGANPKARDAPWSIMLLSGLAVMILAMVILGLWSGEKPGGTYLPPHVEDGEIVPGRVER